MTAHRARSAVIRIGLAGLMGAWTAAAGGAPPEKTARPEAKGPLAAALAGPMADVDEIVFAVRHLGKDGHWYANFSYYAENDQRKAYGKPGARLCKLNLRTRELSVLFEDPQGGIRDPQVHYDAKKILFSYRKGGTDHFHLYEINVDGSGLRQLTDGGYDDIEPSYLPDGDIMFVSSRCKRWVQCWLTQVAVLYRCNADGGDIRQISSNLEHDNTPWLLPDGRVLYQRWEYVDRSQVNYHHLWTANPDGTGQMIYYGNQRPGIVMIDAKPIPGTKKVVSVFSPGHGMREHDGAVTIADPTGGPDHQGFARTINKKNAFRDPYPFSEDCILLARHAELLVMNGQGKTQRIYLLDEPDRQAGMQCHEPRPIQRRPRERVIPSRVDRTEATGRLVLADVHVGRNMTGVKRGEIKELLVIESLPKPINYTGGMEPLSLRGDVHLGADPGHGARRAGRVGLHGAASQTFGVFRRLGRKRSVGQADAEFRRGHAGRDDELRRLSRAAHADAGEPRPSDADGVGAPAEQGSADRRRARRARLPPRRSADSRQALRRVSRLRRDGSRRPAGGGGDPDA